MPSAAPKGRSPNGMDYELTIATRWPDFDALGHLNHAVYHVYLDEARDDALRRTVGDFNQWPNVVVHASIDYRSEVPLGTREVTVRTRIASVGIPTWTESISPASILLSFTSAVAASTAA